MSYFYRNLTLVAIGKVKDWKEILQPKHAAAAAENQFAMNKMCNAHKIK